MRPTRLYFGWCLMSILALCLGIRATQYISINPILYEPELLKRYFPYLPVVAVHATFAILALISGPVVLAEWSRRLSLRIHRWLGGLYALCIVAGSGTGFYMATQAHGGTIAQIGLLFLSFAWFAATAIGIKHAVSRRIGMHRRWMWRSYALTFAAVTLRLELSLLTHAGVEYVFAYQIVTWCSWIGNLLVAELLLRSRPPNARITTLGDPALLHPNKNILQASF